MAAKLLEAALPNSAPACEPRRLRWEGEHKLQLRLDCPTYLVLQLREANRCLDGTRRVYLPQINTFYLESALTRGEYPLLSSSRALEKS